MSKRVAPLVVLSWLILLALLVAAVLSPQVAPHNPVRERLIDRLLPPVWTPDGAWRYLLGTDHLGRDVVSRIIYGSRVSLELWGCPILLLLNLVLVVVSLKL